MARPSKTRTVEELIGIQLAIAKLKSAAGDLRKARAPQAVKSVMAAKKSVEGAERHCKGHMSPLERQVAIKWGVY